MNSYSELEVFVVYPTSNLLVECTGVEDKERLFGKSVRPPVISKTAPARFGRWWRSLTQRDGRVNLDGPNREEDWRTRRNERTMTSWLNIQHCGVLNVCYHMLDRYPTCVT